jgi:aminopeptidase-like protein
MSSRRFKRKGEAELNDESEYTGMVTNLNGTRYALGECIFFVWEYCDGVKTINEIAKDFEVAFKHNQDDPLETVETIIDKLEDMGLVSVENGG